MKFNFKVGDIVQFNGWALFEGRVLSIKNNQIEINWHSRSEKIFSYETNQSSIKRIIIDQDELWSKDDSRLKSLTLKRRFDDGLVCKKI